MVKNKKGWVRIMEAFAAVMLIAGVLLFIVSTYYSDSDISEDIYLVEESFLQEIKLNSSIRYNVLNISNLPMNWSEIQADDSLVGVNESMKKHIPSYLECEALICDISGSCAFDKDIKKEIFVRSAIISAERDLISPKRVFIFCWVK